jgi:SAM-dependent methyltransferase
VGCGTGGISKALAALGLVVAIDLSPAAIEVARQKCPEATFIAGDFYEAALPGPFDAVVTADTIAHVPDQPRFVNRIAELLAPGGTLVLMSQNSYAMKRSLWVPPPAPGQFRHWPTLSEMRRMLARDFEIRRITTAAPMGATSGIFRFLNARRVWAILRRAIGEQRATELYERLWLGSELVVVARRR